MKTKRLGPHEKAILRRSSKPAVESITAKVNRLYFKKGRFLGENNRYKAGNTKFIYLDTQVSKSINHSHMGQYISVSSLLHCSDGWGYLGRALSSSCFSDSSVALHLAYYAELRAAMSILASQGIGIFNDRHMVISRNQDCLTLGIQKDPKRFGQLKTHIVTWLALEHWADLQRSTEAFLKIIKPNGIPLAEWLNAFEYGHSPWPMGSALLKSWGLDLKTLSRDRDFRNESSYRPTKLSCSETVDVLRTSKFIRSIWNECEPTSNSVFENLDFNLLRYCLLNLYRNANGGQWDKMGFKEEIDKMLARLSLNGPVAVKLSGILVNDKNPEVINSALNSSPNVSDKHFHTISRAFLLLRIATGICSSTFNSVGVKFNDLEFWWSQVIKSGGFGEDVKEEDILDLWSDVKEALNVMEEWEVKPMSDPSNYTNWQESCATALIKLGGCERMVLWSLKA